MTWKRVATALVLIPVVVGLVLFASTAAVAIAMAVITVLALWEYFALGEAIGHRAYRVWTIICGLLLIAQQIPDTRFFYPMETPGSSQQKLEPFSNLLPLHFMVERVVRGHSPLLAFFLFLLGLTALTLWSRRTLVEALPAMGMSSSALLLVAFPLSFAISLHSVTFLGPRLLLFALVITWAGDTTAYFVGRAMGKYPLAPRISPKKTWEGSIGSMIASLLVAYAFHTWMYLPVVHLVAMAVIGNVAGQMGDLLESAYKRSAGVKDSGGLLPGHGGVLDRIDALILCIPAIWYYLVLMNPAAI